MYPIIFHFYKSFTVHSYGTMIALGLLLFYYIHISNAKLLHYINKDTVMSLLTYNILAGLIGGKMLYALLDAPNYSIYAFLTSGFSVLGSALGVVATTSVFFYYNAVPLFPTIDLLVLHVPILNIFGRIGCFLAGCCYGTPCTLPWAVSYTHPASLAPLHVPLHPAQLYSAALCMIIYGILLLINRFPYTPMLITSTYISLFAAQRFIMDFVRSDHHDTITYIHLSSHQIISLCIATGGIVCLICSIYYHRYAH
jgi:phosphatidylglycerol:prolipoprotein diacylglycerol transferase